MKRTFIFTIALMIGFVNLFSQSVDFDWAATSGGTGVDFGDGVATDPDGNVFVTGTFRYSMTFLGVDFEPVSEQNTMFLAKVSPEKELEWAVTAEADGVTGAGGFKVQYHDGFVYLMGDFRGDATFFSSDLSETTMSSVTRAMFVAKYTDTGLLEWVKKMESSHVAGIIPIGSANNFVVDDAGAVYVSTHFRVDIDIDGTLVDPEGSGGTNYHMLMVKFDALGAYQWHWNSTHPGDDRGEGLAISPDGNVTFAVRYTSSVTVNEVLYESDGGGIVLIELEDDGTYVWDHNIITEETNRAFLWDMTYCDDDNLYVAGAYRTTLTWDDDNVFEPVNGLRTTAFVLKVDSEGDVLWSTHFGDPDENTNAKTVLVGSNANIYVAGEHNGTMELNEDNVVTSAGGADIFWAVMDPDNGEFLAGDIFGGESNELFGWMAISPLNDIYFIGRYLNIFEIDGEEYESAGSFDFFFVKMTESYEGEDPFTYVLFDEDFNDGEGADRWNFSEIGGTNLVDFAFDYEGAGIPVAPSGEEGTGMKIAVNTSSDDASTSSLIAFPDGQSFEGEYRLTFDLWMNFLPGGAGTTEHVVFGSGHTSADIQMPASGSGSVDGVPGTGPSNNGFDYTMTPDNGAARDVRVFVDGAELLGADGGFADPAIQSTQFAPYTLAYEGDDPGNQWLEITIDFLSDRTIFKVNGVLWAETMEVANPGNLMLGYLDFWSSVANEDSYIVYDNLRVLGEEPEEDPPLPPADPIDMTTLLDKTGANLPPEIGSGGNARGAALYMDRYVVIASRENSPNVWVWDSENPDDDPVALDMGEDIIVPLTFPINYARTAGDAIYVSNLSLDPTGSGWAQGVFQIYRWNDLESQPEVVVSFDALPGRLGDAFSIVGDPQGDGHIIAHINTTKEFRVWTFEDGVLINEDTPGLITLNIEPEHINNHGVYNEIPGEDELFLVTSNNMGLMLADLDGDVHASWGTDIIDMRTYDPNIFYFGDKRFLTYTINNEGNPDIGALYQIVDISIGETLLDAFAAVTTSNDLANRVVYSKSMGAGHPNLTAVNEVGHDDEGVPMVLAHVVGKGFVLELLGEEVVPDYYTITFDVEDEEGFAIDDATISLGGITNDPGDYSFVVMPGIYNYTVVAEGYDDATGNVEVVDADVTLTVVMTEEIPPLPPADPLELITLLNKTGDDLPAEIGTDGNARSAAIYMNRYVVVPSREDGSNVWVWDSENPDEAPVVLDPGAGFEGGLFLVNYVRTVGEHIYVSNMSLGSDAAHPFKIYRWDGLDAEAEVFLTSDAGYGRLGDSFSIIGDPAGDGHIVAHVNSGGEGQRTFRKWDFVGGELQSPDAELVTVEGDYNMNSYGVYNEIEGEDDLFLVTGNGMGIAIAGLDGTVQAYLGTSIVPGRTMEPRVFYYDDKRFLSYVVNNEGNADEGAYYEVIDISIGEDVIEAFNSINTLDDLDLRRAYSFEIGGGTAFLSAAHDISYTDGGNIVLMGHVVARGFVLEATGIDEEEPIDAIDDFPWTEDFEEPWAGEPLAPEDWTVVNGAEDSYWQQTPLHSNSGEFSARSYNGFSSGNLADEWMITPALNLDNPDAAMMVFYGYSNQAPDGVRENMRIMILDELYDNVEDLHANATEIAVVPFTQEWEEYILDISAYSGVKYIAFNYYITEEDDASFNWIYVDDVAVGTFDTFTLTMLEPFGNGTIIPAPGDHLFLEGTEVSLSAEADYTFLFDYWEVDGEFYSDEATTTLVIEGDVTVQAFFEALDSFTLTMLAPEGMGSVTPEPGDYPYLGDDVVELIAIPDFGWMFSHWTGEVEDPNSAVTTILMDDDYTVQAHFVEFDGLELPWSEDFTGLANGTIPANWASDAENWGVNNTNNAGGEAPEMRFNWSPSVEGEYYLYSPVIKTSGHSSLQLTFKNFVNNFGTPGEYTLRVVTIADDVEYLIEEWVDPDNIPAYEFEAILTAAEHGVGTDNFHIAWVFEGTTYDINYWNIDDILLQATDITDFTVTFDVTDADGFAIDDAIITLGDIVNEAGDYVFEGLAEGTYAYTVSRLCYGDVTGEIVVESDVLEEVEMNLDILAGDANGDGVVNLLDVIMIANYSTGQVPDNFCFNNADVNSDGIINIIDVIASINIFAGGKAAPYDDLQSQAAQLHIDDQSISLHSDGTLAGVQFDLAGEGLFDADIKLELPGYEMIHVYEDGILRVLIYSMDNTAIPSGKISLITFGHEVDADWHDAVAANLNAESVPVVLHNDIVTGIESAEEISLRVYPNPATDILWVEFDNPGNTQLSLININGQVVMHEMLTETGTQQVEFNLSGLPAGIYMVRMDHNDTFFIERVIVK